MFIEIRSTRERLYTVAGLEVVVGTTPSLNSCHCIAFTFATLHEILNRNINAGRKILFSENKGKTQFDLFFEQCTHSHK